MYISKNKNNKIIECNKKTLIFSNHNNPKIINFNDIK